MCITCSLLHQRVSCRVLSSSIATCGVLNALNALFYEASTPKIAQKINKQEGIWMIIGHMIIIGGFQER